MLATPRYNLARHNVEGRRLLKSGLTSAICDTVGTGLNPELTDAQIGYARVSTVDQDLHLRAPNSMREAEDDSVVEGLAEQDQGRDALPDINKEIAVLLDQCHSRQ